MNKWLEILIGLVLINISVYVILISHQWGAFWNFGHAAWLFLKGGVLWSILLVGVLFVILGISNMKD
jgi:hypothetical protein